MDNAPRITRIGTGRVAGIVDHAHTSVADFRQEFEITQAFDGKGRLRWGVTACCPKTQPTCFSSR